MKTCFMVAASSNNDLVKVYASYYTATKNLDSSNFTQIGSVNAHVVVPTSNYSFSDTSFSLVEPKLL